MQCYQENIIDILNAVKNSHQKQNLGPQIVDIQMTYIFLKLKNAYEMQNGG